MACPDYAQPQQRPNKPIPSVTHECQTCPGRLKKGRWECWWSQKREQRTRSSSSRLSKAPCFQGAYWTTLGCKLLHADAMGARSATKTDNTTSNGLPTKIVVYCGERRPSSDRGGEAGRRLAGGREQGGWPRRRRGNGQQPVTAAVAAAARGQRPTKDGVGGVGGPPAGGGSDSGEGEAERRRVASGSVGGGGGADAIRQCRRLRQRQGRSDQPARARPATSRRRRWRR